MTPVVALETTGRMLFGERWRAPLARRLQRPGAGYRGVAERQLHYWLADASGIQAPAWVPGALVQLLREEAATRKETLVELADRLEATVAA